jgi:hypothetical protein
MGEPGGWVEYIETPDGTIDISNFRPDPPLETGQEYKTQSAVNYATEAQLRSAGTEYPEWVTERFLQLPDSITPRMVELATSLTESEPTVYEKTVSIITCAIILNTATRSRGQSHLTAKSSIGFYSSTKRGSAITIQLRRSCFCARLASRLAGRSAMRKAISLREIAPVANRVVKTSLS